MRLGLSSAFTHLAPKEWAERLAGLGCTSAVFPVNSSAPEELIEEYCVEAKKRDLLIAEVGIWKNAISPDPKEEQETMDFSIRQLKLADRIKARCCVNVSGAMGELWDGGYRENLTPRAWDKTIRMIQEVIDEAKPENTFFTIEPMPWMYPTGPREYLKMIEEVKRDQFGVHMDIINMINCPQRYFFPEKFLEECFELLGPYIKSCHMKDIQLSQELTFQLKECACGEGSFPLELYAELADKADPDMPMIIEHLHSDAQYMESLDYVKKRLGI